MLNWLKRIADRVRGRVSLVSPWLQGVVWTIQRHFLALARDAYGQNAVVYACIRTLAESIGEAPLIAYEVDAEHNRHPLPFDHPLRRLVRAPNEQMTEYEMVEMIETHLGIAGRSCWIKRRNLANEVIALYPLRPDRVGPIYAKDKTGETGEDDSPVLWGWAYAQPGAGEIVELPRSEVMTFLLPDPAGETGGIVEGLGPLQVLAREVEADNEATSFVYAMLKNNATPSGILKVKSPIPNDAAFREIKRRWMAQFGGARRGETAVLDADSDYMSVGFSLQQLEFPNLRHVSEARIAAAFRVPAILLGLKVGLDAGIRATIQDQRKYFTETTLKSRWRRLSDTFTNQLATEFGVNIILRYDTSQVPALADQSRFEVQPIKEAFQAGGATIDEYRVKVLGLPPLGGDQGSFLLVPLGVQAVLVGPDAADMVDSINAEANTYAGRDEVQDPAAERPAAKGSLGQPHPHAGARGRRWARHQGPAGERGPVRDPVFFGGRPGTGGVPPVEAKPKRPKRHARAKRRHGERVTRRADAMMNRLGAALSMQALAAQQRVAMNHAKAWEPTGEIVTEGERQRLIGILKDLWIASLHDAHREMGEEFGAPLAVDLRDPQIKAHLNALGAKADLILGACEGEVLGALEGANEGGHDRPTIDRTIATLPAFSPARIARVARHEAAEAANVAALLAFAKAGVGEVIVIEEEGGCEECAAADGAVWTIEQALANPLGHVGCARAFYPILAEDDEGMAAD